LGPGALDVVTLRETWRRHSLAAGWVAADDWHTAAVDAVAEAILFRGEPSPRTPAADRGEPSRRTPTVPGVPAADLAHACGSLGRARAKAGVGIAAAIADLAALYAVLDGGSPPLHLVSSIAEGWAEEGLARESHGHCEDPLTGLTTVPYLRTRLAELYREADQLGISPAHTHRLIVISSLPRADPWHRMAGAIRLGHDLRAAFPGGDTLSQVPGPGAGIALVQVRWDLPSRYTDLRHAMQVTCGTQTRIIPLPARLSEALRLVEDLAH
jgi:hypothetical protein